MMVTHWIVEIMSVMFLMPTQEFGGTMMMTISLKLVILPKEVYIIKSHKKKPTEVMSGSIYILFLVYIITNNLTKYSSIFQQFSSMSKINHIKKVIEDLNVFRKYFRVTQKDSDEIKTRFFYINDELQTSIENIIYLAKKEVFFWLNGD